MISFEIWPLFAFSCSLLCPWQILWAPNQHYIRVENSRNWRGGFIFGEGRRYNRLYPPPSFFIAISTMQTVENGPPIFLSNSLKNNHTVFPFPPHFDFYKNSASPSSSKTSNTLNAWGVLCLIIYVWGILCFASRKSRWLVRNVFIGISGIFINVFDEVTEIKN